MVCLEPDMLDRRELDDSPGKRVLAPVCRWFALLALFALLVSSPGQADAQSLLGDPGLGLNDAVTWSKDHNRLAIPFAQYGLPADPTSASALPEPACDLFWDVGLNARAFYLHDSRIEFTGQESTFAVEAAVRGQAAHRFNGTTGYVYTELFLNQPFDRNLLTDYALRESFSHNFEIEPFEISQLALGVSRGDWSLEIGRFATPFGRYAAPVFLNDFQDMPFIRSESILARETGVQARFDPGPLRVAVAFVNGSLGRDTNSSKALIARIGCETPQYALGTSIKMQDGIGSEGNKEFNNHAGVDGYFRLNDWLSVAGEFIYDQYGMRKPGVSLDSITWGRSLYNRQIHRGVDQPLEGYGYYFHLVASHGCLESVAGYGEFYPEPVGDPIHDEVTRRFYGNTLYRLTPYSSVYATLMLENEVLNAQGGRTRHGFVILSGLQFQY